MVIENIVLGVIGFFLLYLLFLSIVALFAFKRQYFHTQYVKRIAVVVPAHNEELTIGRTIENLKNVDYPPDQFDVIVVADNCTDLTPAIAMQYDATVIERVDNDLRGKGYALQYAFTRLLDSPREYEGIVVIDADSVVSKNFLTVMNFYLTRGYESIQSADLVVPKYGVWSSEVSRVSLTLYNYVRPLGRKMLDFSAGLRGNGMCFSSELLRRIPWTAHSVTEDLEYGIIILLNNVVTIFAPEAKVFATMPSRPKNAESQRARWETGRFSIIRKYTPLLFFAAIKRRSGKLVDSLIELLTPAFVNMVGIIILVIITKYTTAYFGFRDIIHSVGGWWLLLGVSIVYVLIGLRAAEADPGLFKAILYFPLYLLWKIQLYVKLLLTGISKEWVRTTRENGR